MSSYLITAPNRPPAHAGPGWWRYMGTATNPNLEELAVAQLIVPTANHRHVNAREYDVFRSLCIQGVLGGEIAEKIAAHEALTDTVRRWVVAIAQKVGVTGSPA